MSETYSFGYWVLRRRKALDLTRDELARRVGCVTETIKKIERDERRPSRQIAELLATALDVPPEEQTLFLQVARGERAVDQLPLVTQPLRIAPEQSHNLPVHLTSFFGREDELATIDRLFDNPEYRLLTLVGPGGIGKTRLALRIAECKVDAFLNGVWLVTLAPLQSAEHIVPAIASAIRFNLSDKNDPKTQLLTYLHSKELLLVLDNFEHLMDGATLVTEILKTAPKVKILVTSRERLNLQVEFLFKIEGLTYPSHNHIHLTDSFSAVQLFVERACRIHPQLRFSEDDYAAITRICRLVEGLPLAIELAAAWTHILSCSEIAQEIELSLGILTVSTRDVPERHRSMRAVFDHSWKFLSEDEHVVLRQLSIFRGGFTREAAEQVSGASLTILSSLADRSLLQLDQRLDDGQRYDLHELVRQYAEERLLETGQTDLLRERHLRYFLRLAEEAELKLRGAEQIDWLDMLKVEHDNFRTALEWALSNNSEEGLRLVGAAWWYWRVCGYVSEGCEWMSKMLALPNAMAHTLLRAKVLYGAAFLESIRYDNARAQALYEESLSLYTELEDKSGAADALNGLGFIAERVRDWETSRRHFEAGLKIGFEVQNKHAIAVSLEGLGIIAEQYRNWANARTFFEQFLAMERELGNITQIAHALRRLGGIAFTQGDISMARARFEESLSIFRELNFKQFIAILLSNLASVARYEGKYEQASALYSDSLSLLREKDVGFESNQAMVLCSMGYVAYRQGQQAPAGELFEESLLLCQKLGEHEGSALCLVGIAGILASKQRPEQAVRLISAARAVFDALDAKLNPSNQGEYEHNLATARTQLNQTAFQVAWAEGYAMSLEQAIAYALDDDEITERNAAV